MVTRINVTGANTNPQSNNTKRVYKPGSKVGDYLLVKVVKEEYRQSKATKDRRYIRTWLIECACGYRRTESTPNIHRLTRCLTCARYLSRNGNNFHVLRMYQMTQHAMRDYYYVETDGYVRTVNYLLPDWAGLEGPLK